MEQAFSIFDQNKPTPISQWGLKKKLFQTSRNYNQLQNRVKILQIQKKKKVKNIQRKLQEHQKQVRMKIHKSVRKADLEGRNNQDSINQSINFQLNQSIREGISMNINNHKNQLLESRKKMFFQSKLQLSEIQRIKKEQKQKDLQQKINKRNRVRMMQIQSKQNISKYWNKKINIFRINKNVSIQNKMKLQKNKLTSLMRLQKVQEKILNDIKNTEQLQDNLNNVIIQEREMKGRQLRSIYNHTQQ